MTQYPIISINGEMNGQISVFDRGFSYGDGFFETCHVHHNKIHLWDLHLQRLLKTAEKLSIPLEQEKLIQFVDALLNQNDSLEYAILKIQITRGIATRGYAYEKNLSPTYCLLLSPGHSFLKQQWRDGINVRICDLRLADFSPLAGLKHLNRLENVLARAEWKDEYAEGFLFNTKAQLIEGTMSNIFLVKNGKLLTPDLSQAGVAGVMREYIMKTLSPSVSITSQETLLTLDDVLSADEIFICNSVIGIWPVVKIYTDQMRDFSIGNITRSLQAGLLQNVIA